MDNSIELKPVKDLLGMNFFIPEYQRGYRWKTRQVLDLLEDLQDFMDTKTNGSYCLQPLVVNKHQNTDDIRQKVREALENNKEIDTIKEILQDQWDVVDGQQRLTTLFILIRFLSSKTGNDNYPYRIEYETRPGSREFLFNIEEKRASDNIDFWHIYNTQVAIENWFKKKNKTDKDKEQFLQTILNQIEFIWYKSEEEPIEVFTRLNIGKISLTNAELVKALLLNKANFNDGSIPSQNEVAIIWDQIEYTLQNDRFWCFLHDEGYNQPTRIDFLLELILKLKNKGKEGDFWFVKKEDLGNDDYQTFRYFYQLLLKEENKQFHLVWNEIVNLYNLLKEWYNDNECYHYIGFMSTVNERAKKPNPIPELITKWTDQADKNSFVDYLKNGEKDKGGIKSLIMDVSNLNQQYELADANDSDEQDNDAVTKGKRKIFPSKTKCFPLLLLFNIQTIVDKNELFKQNEKFNALSFERFPFDLFKKEKGWDIEHIASNTDNSLESSEQRKEWLTSVKENVDSTLKGLIDDYLHKGKQETDDDEFNKLKNEIEGQESNLNSKDKNKVWNFCLLDQSTNRGYGNSIFATKRKWILNRERGLDANGQSLKDEKHVFVPPCTLRVFTKFYTSDTTDLSKWNEKDAEAYRNAIIETLKEFGVTKP